MTLYLLPNLLADEMPIEEAFVPKVTEVVSSLTDLVCESEKAARRFLRRFVSHESMQTIHLHLLNEHTQKNQIQEILAQIQKGKVFGLISDAGLPCIADPGRQLVALARKKGVLVHALAGPTSIIMALQLSGLSGQSFTFHGYLSKERSSLEKEIQGMLKEKRTHVWIETPYRNQRMLQTLCETLPPLTILCVARNLGTPSFQVETLPLSAWKERSLPKEPAVFCLTPS